MRKLTRTPYLSLFVLVIFGCQKYYVLIPPPSPAHVFQISPSHGPDSTLVTITGISFGAGDSVYFNGKLATLVSASDTQLVARVPTLAGTGTVTVVGNGKVLNGGTFTYDTTWRTITFADSLPVPFYLSIDSTGTLYVPTYNNGVINKISPQGVVSTFANAYVFGTALDAAGNLYAVINGIITHIYKYNSLGGRTLVATDSGTIYSIALDKQGNIYAANSSTNMIDKITPGGTITALGGGTLYYVSGVAVASDGSIYATNYTTPAYNNLNGVVSKISPSGAVSIVTKARYDGTSGIVIDENDNVYVTSTDQSYGLGSVFIISPAGVVRTVTPPGLYFPCGITRDRHGNLYVASQEDTPGTPYIGRVVKMTMH